MAKKYTLDLLHELIDPKHRFMIRHLYVVEKKSQEVIAKTLDLSSTHVREFVKLSGWSRDDGAKGQTKLRQEKDERVRKARHAFGSGALKSPRERDQAKWKYKMQERIKRREEKERVEKKAKEGST